MKGMIEKGISEIKIAVDISGGWNAAYINDLAYAYARAGKMDEVRDILTDLF